MLPPRNEGLAVDIWDLGPTCRVPLVCTAESRPVAQFERGDLRVGTRAVRPRGILCDRVAVRYRWFGRLLSGGDLLGERRRHSALPDRRDSAPQGIAVTTWPKLTAASPRQLVRGSQRSGTVSRTAVRLGVSPATSRNACWLLWLDRRLPASLISSVPSVRILGGHGMSARRGFASWQVGASVVVGIGVCFSVLLISVAFGVNDDINSRLSGLGQSGIDTTTIHTILALLTVVVTAAMLFQTGAMTFVIGVTTMRGRRAEVALRRQSGVLRSTLIREFAKAMLIACMAGGVTGEVVGIGIAGALRAWTVMPIRFTTIALFASFPVTVLIAIGATIYPAWKAANASPALLRKQ